MIKKIIKHKRSTIVIVCGKSGKRQEAQLAQSRCIIFKCQCRLLYHICVSLFVVFFPNLLKVLSHQSSLCSDMHSLWIQIKCKSLISLLAWEGGGCREGDHICVFRNQTLSPCVSHHSTPLLLSVKSQKRLCAAGVGCGRVLTVLLSSLAALRRMSCGLGRGGRICVGQQSQEKIWGKTFMRFKGSILMVALMIPWKEKNLMRKKNHSLPHKDKI